ncbi:MAG: helix-turn-helix domain-containing protein, partial [Deltaproteobacteria bacterium]|nr:helix-turn-helix domain-containing protein [Deltaproteobacteria bacterium]
MREALLDVKEVSGLLHVHPKTIYDWKTSNKLPSVTVNGRVRFDRKQLDEFLGEKILQGLAESLNVSIAGAGPISDFLGWNIYRVKHALERLGLIDEGIVEPEAVRSLPTERA